MRNTLWFVVLVSVGIVSYRPVVDARGAVAPAQTVTVASDADTYVASGRSGTTNFGSAEVIRVGGMFPGDNNANFRSLVRFSGLAAAVPQGAVIDEATLRLQHLSSAGSLVIQARLVTATWAESTVTWDTQPGATDPTSSRAVGAGAGVYDWDVTAQVAEWVSGAAANHGFLLRAADESVNAVKPFRSREGAVSPGGGTPAPPSITLEVVWHLPSTPTATATPTRERPTPTATATLTPTLTASPTHTSTAELPSRTPTPSDEPPTHTPTPERTRELPDISVGLGGGCGATLAIGDTVTLVVESGLPGTIVLERWPGPVTVAEVSLPISQPLTARLPWTVDGPAGPGRITAQLLEAEGANASCGFLVAEPRVPTPTATRPGDDFITPEPDPWPVWLPTVLRNAHPPVPPGPGDITVPSAKGREVAIAYERELLQPARVVAAVGGGASYRLLSYAVDAQAELSPLAHGPLASGYDVRVSALGPPFGDGPREVFMSAARRLGQLWLTSWRLQADGTPQKLHSLGYGGPGIEVTGYAIAVRPIVQDGFVVDWVVVTPVLNGGQQIRLVSWTVHPGTGVISGRDDTGDWYQTAPDSPLDIAYLQDAEVLLDPASGFPGGTAYDIDRMFGLTFRNRDGNLGIWLVTAQPNGTLGWFGGGESGVNMRGTEPLAYASDDARVARLTRTGIVVGNVDGNVGPEPEPIVWDYRSVSGQDGLVPHRISRAIWDLTPDDRGVVLSQDDPANADFIGTAVDGERALVTDLEWEDLGDGNGALYAKASAGSWPAGNIGSVTKVMSLLLILQALEAGEVSLDDVITVPPEGAEAGPAWMSPPLDGGEQVELETLLHGMMKRSSNGATRTIAWHVAGARYGTDLDYDTRIEAFLADMNDMAGLIGLEDTLHCGVGGGSHSSPPDLVKLWRIASEQPLFWTFAGVNTYDPPCAVDAEGDPKCFASMSKGTLGFPGLEGEKDGLQNQTAVGYDSNGQLACGVYDPQTTLDACRQCRIGQLTRLGRPFAAVSLQSDEAANDVRDLLTYGLLRIFTPDRRASTAEQAVVAAGEAAVDFALASRGTLPLVTAVVTESGELRLCTFGVNGGIGQLARIGCQTVELPSLGPIGSYVPPLRPEMSPVDTLTEAEGDYVTAWQDAALTRLKLWRIGPRDPSW